MLLMGVAKKQLNAIFGPALHANGNGATVNVSTGNASLGCLVPTSPPVLTVNSWGKVRMQVNDGVLNADLSVTDVRLHEYGHDGWSARTTAVQQVNHRIQNGVDVILSVGLARAFKAQNDTEPRHWLQVNGIHLADDPVWQYTP